MARKFLYIVAALTALVIAVLFALRFWAEDLTALALVPTAKFEAQPALAAQIYDDPAMWYARPGVGDKDLARWHPDGFVPASDAREHAAVFFIHPTSYLTRDRWNAPLGDVESRQRAELFVKAMASPFNASTEVWAPRYRQAAIGAFLTADPQATQALDLAYGDIRLAFDHFLANVGADQPIVLAGHSQGAFLLTRLLHDKVAGRPLAQRIVAAYVIGWPLSPERDLPALGLPACAEPVQTGCVASWLSFADPADPSMVLNGYAHRLGLTAERAATGGFLCTNPLTGTIGGTAEAQANLGTLVPDEALTTGKLVVGQVPARCGPDGFLHVGDPPQLGPYVLPGNNYHVYDIPLFWANLRADVARREAAWKP